MMEVFSAVLVQIFFSFKLIKKLQKNKFFKQHNNISHEFIGRFTKLVLQTIIGIK